MASSDDLLLMGFGHDEALGFKKPKKKPKKEFDTSQAIVDALAKKIEEEKNQKQTDDVEKLRKEKEAQREKERQDAEKRAKDKAKNVFQKLTHNPITDTIGEVGKSVVNTAKLPVQGAQVVVAKATDNKEAESNTKKALESNYKKSLAGAVIDDVTKASMMLSTTGLLGPRPQDVIEISAKRLEKQGKKDEADALRKKGYDYILEKSGVGKSDSKGTVYRKAVGTLGTAVADVATGGATGASVKAGVQTGKKIVQDVVKSSGKTSVAFGSQTALSKMREDDIKPKDVLKAGAEGAVAGAVLGGGANVLGKGIKKAKDSTNIDLTNEKLAVINQIPSEKPKGSLKPLGKKEYVVHSLDEIDAERAVFLKKKGYQTAKDSSGKTIDLDSPNQKQPDIIDSVNPTGGVHVDYNPQARVEAKLADNITTLDKTSGKNADEMVTIYRGAPKNQKEIVPGDFISTNHDLAKAYSGEGNVIEKKVPLRDILDDKTESLGEEYIYRPTEKPQVFDEAGNLIEDNTQYPKYTRKKDKEPVYEPIEEPKIDSSPEIKTSGLASRTEQKAIEAKITEGFGDLPEYAKMNMSDQAKHAIELTKTDHEYAKRIALGHEKPPGDLRSGSVYTTVVDKAVKDGDSGLLLELSKSKLSNKFTEMGQEIKSLDVNSDTSAIGKIKELRNARIKAKEAKIGSVDKAVKETTREIKKSIKTPTKTDWNMFVESIKC